MIALLASFLLSTNATPRELVLNCRTMIPANVELEGRLVLRNRKGIPLAEHDYVLTRSNAVTRLVVDGEIVESSESSKEGEGEELRRTKESKFRCWPQSSALQPSPPPPSTSTSLLGTDVTWSDLTLDYLWWDDFSFDAERESETVHGQVCSVVVMKKDDRVVRVWVDRKTGALMQAEEFQGDKAIRRLWGTRIKKFGDRWMANVLEVETVGSGHRTKITVEKLK